MLPYDSDTEQHGFTECHCQCTVLSVRSATDFYVHVIYSIMQTALKTGVDCIHVAYDRQSWQAVVDRVTNLLVPQNVGSSLTR
jgi:phosphopantetheine adenylyltransferase